MKAKRKKSSAEKLHLREHRITLQSDDNIRNNASACSTFGSFITEIIASKGETVAMRPANPK